MYLEFCPRDEVLDWANKIVEDNKNKRVIITTHSYLDYDDIRINSTKVQSCSKHKFLATYNDGEEIWNKFVKKHQNIFLILSGHVTRGDSVGYLKSMGINNNEVHQISANSQRSPEGYLRIMKFSPLKNRIFVQSYSSSKDSYRNSSKNKFDFYYDMTRK